MKTNRILRVLALFGVLSLVSLQSIATDLRGRVDGMHSYAQRPFPLSGARVDLYLSTQRGQVLIRSAYTGGDGIYYMWGINPGLYTLQVNGRSLYPLRVNAQPRQDIKPILFQ
jgi:hypothetical protein